MKKGHLINKFNVTTYAKQYF